MGASDDVLKRPTPSSHSRDAADGPLVRRLKTFVHEQDPLVSTGAADEDQDVRSESSAVADSAPVPAADTTGG